MNANLEKGRAYRWKPGESGNPGGRPRRRPISERYAECAEIALPEKERIKRGLARGATYGDALVFDQFNAALNGRTEAAREIREAIEGKAAQRMETRESEKGPVSIRVTYEDHEPKGASDDQLLGPAQDANR